jgi:micrococcal nuclease
MRRIVIIVILTALTLCLCTQKVQNEVYVKVIDVIDGDTIVVDMNGKLERVRLIGVDTPELKAEKNKPYEYDNITNLTLLAEWGWKAKEFAEKWLEGKIVKLEFDEFAGYRDKYGRILAYVYVNGTDFNALLLEKGLARVYVTKFKKLEYYMELEKKAFSERRGLWRFAS